MKKIIALILSIALLLVLAACGAETHSANTWACSCGKVNDDAFCSGCGSKKPTDTQSASEQNPTIESIEEDSNETEAVTDPHNVDAINLTSVNGTIQFSGIQMASAALLEPNNEGYKDGDAILVEYIFTCTQSRPAKINEVFEITYYQNGKQIPDSLWISGEDKEQFELCDNYYLELLNGGSSAMAKAVLAGDKSPITVIVTDLADEDNYQVMVIDNLHGGDSVSEMPVENSVTFEEPIVLLDNQHIKIIVTGKCDATVIGRDNTLGYTVTMENKSDSQYVLLAMTNCSIDGYMLEDSCYFGNDTLAPGKKSNTHIFLYTDREHALGLETIADLVNWDGSIQISFSDDGQTYRNHTVFPFDNIVP